MEKKFVLVQNTNSRFVAFTVLLLMVLLFASQSCSSKKERKKQQEFSNQKVLEQNQKNEDLKQKNVIASNDSIIENNLIIKYNAFTEIDTLYHLYSFKIREIIQRHSNIVAFKGDILDFDRSNIKNTVTFALDEIYGIGKFYCNSEIFQKLSQKSGNERNWKRVFIIVRVSDFSTVSGELSVSGSSESSSNEASNDYIKIPSLIRPYYIFHGEIIDFYL